MKKKLEQWSKLKLTLNNINKNIKIKQGEIYFLSIGQNIGYETYGKKKLFLRPVLIYKKLTKSTFVGIPLTSKEKIGSYFYSFKYKQDILSTAMFNQIRVFDIKRIIFEFNN